MNHTYRVIWNDALGAWQAIGECGPARGKTKSKRLRVLALVIGALAIPGGIEAAELPAGGEITAGMGLMHQSGSNLTITQDSSRLAIDWQSFSIGEGASVRFNQPSSDAVALNRVLGSDVSVIQGALDANGQVFLINPNGVLFTSTARVNAGGLVSSTLDLSKEDFLAGRYRFDGESENRVINRGSITTANGGTVALLAAKVENTGRIVAPQGQVMLGAGNTVTLDLGGPARLQVEQGAVDALIENGGAIRADGGTVLLTAKAAEDVAGMVINNTGILEARTSAIGEDGSIVLLGERGTVAVAGSIDVSAGAGAGGKAVVTGERVVIADGARLDAAGAQGGGEIYVGGGWQGQDPDLRRAVTTTIAAGATIEASAGDSGDGGTVVVWSDGETRFAGSIKAAGGNGGRVEVSGKETLGFTGEVDTGGGTLLLDPADIVVQSAAGDASNSFSGAQIRTLLDDNDVTLTADNTITWNADAALDYDGIGTDRTLTLDADSDITINGTIEDSVAGGDALSIVINAGGRVNVEGIIHSGENGNIDIDAGEQIWSKGGLIEAGGTGNLNVDGAGGFQVDAGTVRVADGTLRVNVNSNINPIWGGKFVATGAGDIELTSRALGIYLGGSGSSSGSVSAQSGDITLTADIIDFRTYGSVSGNGALLLQPYSAEASIGIGTGASGTLNLSTVTPSKIADGFDSITIGRSDGSGAIDVRSVAYKDDLVLRTPAGSGGIALNGILSTTGTTIMLESAGGVSQAAGGGIQADKVLLLGAGDFILSAGTNDVGTIAVDIDGALVFHDENALTIGSAGGKDGVAATGAIEVATRTADLTVGEAITTIDTSDSAIVLNAGRNTSAGAAGGGNVILDAALVTGSEGRATIYTGSIEDSTGVATAAGGPGSGHFRYGSDEAGTNYTAALGSGIYAIYRERPTLSVGPGAASGQYGETPDLGDVTYSVSGYRNGDTGGLSGTAIYTTAATSTSGVGSYDIAYASGLSSTLGYAIADDSDATGEYTVTPRVLKLSGSRTYDGTTDLAAGIFTLGNLVNGDTLTLSGAGSLATKDAGIGKTVSLGTLAIGDGADGDAASNYTLAGGTHVADISKASLTVRAADRTATYDGAVYDGGYSVGYSGFVGGEDSSVLGGALSYGGASQTARNAGTYAITASGLASDNYDISYQSGTLTIDKAALTVSAADRTATYDGAVYDGGYAVGYSGFVGGEDSSVLGGALSYGGTSQTARNAGTYDIAVSGLASDNYEISYQSGTLTIDKAALTVSSSDVSKTYDGTLCAAGTAIVVGGRLYGSDSLSGGSFAFADPDAGTGKTVTVSGVSVNDGNGGGNYRVSYADNTSSTIEKKTLTLTGSFAVSDKVYDGTTMAAIAGSSGLTLAGLAGAEDVGLNGLAAAFAGKDAADGKTVHLTAASLADGTSGKASNYRLDLSGAPTATADIGRRPVIVAADNQAKSLGMPDPALAYTAEVQSGNRGLLSGETLNGALVRQSGNDVGRYVISQGSMTDANNPNYAIAFVEGLLSINPSPEIEAAQHLAQVLPESLSPRPDLTSPTAAPQIGARPAFEAVAAGEPGPVGGGADTGSGDANGTFAVEQPVGPLNVFVIEGGIRYPDMSKRRKE